MRLPVISSSGPAVACSIISDMDALQTVSRLLNRSIETHPVEPRYMSSDVLRYLCERRRIDAGLIAVRADNGDGLKVYAMRGMGGSVADEVSVDFDVDLVARVVGDGKPVMGVTAGDFGEFLSLVDCFDPDRPLVAMPIVTKGPEPCGMVVIQPLADLSPMEGQAKFTSMLATLIGQSIHIARTTELEREELYEERETLRRSAKTKHDLENIIGNTPAMQMLFNQVRLVAKWNTTVLIRGESGTGKELIASAIHFNSPRAGSQFIKLNCAALPDTLLESELFGHEKGAFTGAAAMRKGRFEQADGGTLFLDEIGEITAAFQSKLLRVLQEGEFERVGGTKTIKVNVRIIAATNRNLEAAVEDGSFRDDLYYRLNVMPLNMPPLRDRRDDIPELARFLLDKIGRNQGRTLSITSSAIRLLTSHSWPGNVRELENCLERASVMSQLGTIDRDVISLIGIGDGRLAPRSTLAECQPVPIRPREMDFEINGNGSAPPKARDWNDPDLGERDRVIAALEEAGWVQAKAARLLKMTPRQIAYRIQTLDIPMRRI